MTKALIDHVDCVCITVKPLEDGYKFYHDKLGFNLVWRSEHKIGLMMEDGKTELVLQDDDVMETDLKVSSVEETIKSWGLAGGKLSAGPKDIPIGNWALIEDPWGNKLSILDTSKGTFITNKGGEIIGLNKGE